MSYLIHLIRYSHTMSLCLPGSTVGPPVAVTAVIYNIDEKIMVFLINIKLI